MDLLNGISLSGIVALMVLDKMGILDRFIPKKNGNGNGNGHTDKTVEELKNYYNHDLTERLSNLHEAIKENTEAIRESTKETTRTFNDHFKIEIQTQEMIKNINQKVHERN